MLQVLPFAIPKRRSLYDRMKQKITLILSIASGFILLSVFLVGHIFPDLTFVHRSLTIASRMLGYIVFSVFILSILIYFKASGFLTIPLGVILFLMFFINSCAEIYPVDTTRQARDISVLQTNKDGSKLIVRERINVKTNEVVRDTALVKDNFIFRRELGASK